MITASVMKELNVQLMTLQVWKHQATKEKYQPAGTGRKYTLSVVTVTV